MMTCSVAIASGRQEIVKQKVAVLICPDYLIVLLQAPRNQASEHSE